MPPTRRQLAFEPLEPRELLAADVGSDWWSYWDSPTADDWSWTFDDASGYDTAGAGSWGDDAWWAGDVAWDVPADGGAEYAGDVGTGFDAGGSDWTADFGDTDAGWMTDVVAPPAFDADAGAADEPDATVIDVVSPPVSQPEPTVVVVSPAVTTPADPTPAVNFPGQAAEVQADVDVEGTADAVMDVADDEVPVDDTEEPIIDSPPPIIIVTVDGDATADDAAGFVWDLTAGSDETATNTPADDGAYENADAGEPVPTDVVDVTIVDVPEDIGEETWVYYTVGDALPAEGVPSEPTADSGGDAVVDVVADVVAENTGEPTIVIVTPVGSGPTRSADVPVVPSRPVASGIDGSRFAAWAAGFMQAFWRPAGDVDGAVAGGLASGQTGTGRPRIRLPFRPIV